MISCTQLVQMISSYHSGSTNQRQRHFWAEWYAQEAHHVWSPVAAKGMNSDCLFSDCRPRWSARLNCKAHEPYCTCRYIILVILGDWCSHTFLILIAMQFTEVINIILFSMSFHDVADRTGSCKFDNNSSSDRHSFREDNKEEREKDQIQILGDPTNMRLSVVTSKLQ